MKLIDKLEAVENSIVELQNKIENSQDVAELKGFTHELNSLQAQKRVLSEIEIATENHAESVDYLNTEKSFDDFKNALVADRKAGNEGYPSWAKKLAENGLTVEDPIKYLPSKIVQDIQSAVLENNDVLKLADLTHKKGALLMIDYSDNDTAHVHVPGTTKVVQNSKIKTSMVQPRHVYIRRGFDAVVAQTTDRFDEIYQLFVDDAVQKITNLIVDLMLVKGTATPSGTGSDEVENGFISIKNESDTGKVMHIDGKTDLLGAIERAVDELTLPGKKYLVVTTKQKDAILKALRTRQPQVNFSTNKKAIAAEFGLDDILFYRGTEKIKPTIITENSYVISMGAFDRYDQFRIENNTEDLLIETLAVGRTLKYGGIAVIDIADE